MGRLNLKANNINEKAVLNYLESAASDTLVERINNGKKTITDCWAFIVSEAKKHAKNGCACIDDQTVFGWAVHFFEEDTIKIKAIAPTSQTKEKDKKAAKPKQEAKGSVTTEQISFDFF